MNIIWDIRSSIVRVLFRLMCAYVIMSKSAYNNKNNHCCQVNSCRLRKIHIQTKKYLIGQKFGSNWFAVEIKQRQDNYQMLIYRYFLR